MKKGIIVQIVGLTIMGVGIGLQFAKSEMYYLFITFLGLFFCDGRAFYDYCCKEKRAVNKVHGGK